MKQKELFNCGLEYATVSVDKESYVAKEPVVPPYVKIFFDKTFSKNGGEQNKLHFRFVDVEGRIIQVVAYFDKDVNLSDYFSDKVPMKRNLEHTKQEEKNE